MHKTNISRIVAPLALIAFAALASCAHEANRHGDPALAAQAAIPFEQAQTLTLAARPGEVREWELEREHGGLRYSFDIAAGENLYEVGIDANSGAVLENDLDH